MAVRSEPTTEAGRTLLSKYFSSWGQLSRHNVAREIAAIEAEARRDAVVALRRQRRHLDLDSEEAEHVIAALRNEVAE